MGHARRRVDARRLSRIAHVPLEAHEVRVDELELDRVERDGLCLAVGEVLAEVVDGTLAKSDDERGGEAGHRGEGWVEGSTRFHLTVGEEETSKLRSGVRPQPHPGRQQLQQPLQTLRTWVAAPLGTGGSSKSGSPSHSTRSTGTLVRVASRRSVGAAEQTCWERGLNQRNFAWF